MDLVLIKKGTLFVGGGLPGLNANYPSAQLLIGAFFYPPGLVFIVLTGAELVTSNMMVYTITVLQRKATIWDLAKSWTVSWLGNLAGSFFVGYILVYFTGVLSEEPYRWVFLDAEESRLTLSQRLLYQLYESALDKSDILANFSARNRRKLASLSSCLPEHVCERHHFEDCSNISACMVVCDRRIRAHCCEHVRHAALCAGRFVDVP